MRVSLDGYDFDNDELVEVKFVSADYIKELSNGGKIREDHLAQIYFQLHVTGGKEGHYFAMAKDGSHFATKVEQTSKEELENIIFQVDSFLESLEGGQPPKLSSDDYMEVEAPDLINDLRLLGALKKEMDSAKKQEAIIRKRIIAHAPHGKLQIDNIKFFQSKGRVTCDYKKACEVNNIDTAKYMKQGKPSWTLRISE
jgi:predicted phage-related endonuclease